MSVLIKGIDTPERCWRCPCYDQERWECRGLGFKRVNPEIARYTRPEDCPLVEVPTRHGRLIDADKELFELACSMFPQDMDYTNAIAIAKRYLREMPTVIEAEE